MKTKKAAKAAKAATPAWSPIRRVTPATQSARVASPSGRRSEGARCNYVGASGKGCVRKASTGGKCTLHIRRLAGVGAEFYLEFVPTAKGTKLQRKGPFRAAKANKLLAQLSHQRAELLERGFTVRQVRA